MRKTCRFYLCSRGEADGKEIGAAGARPGADRIADDELVVEPASHDGISLRVPTPTVSVVDLNVLVDKTTTAEDVNAKFKAAADGPLKGLLEYVAAPLVSIDFRGNPHSASLDAPSTKVMDGNFVKVLAWYDNEWGYSSRCVDLILHMAKKGL